MTAMRWTLLALILTPACTGSPLEPTPRATNIVCPTGCPTVSAVVTFPGVPPDAPTYDRRHPPCGNRCR